MIEEFTNKIHWLGHDGFRIEGSQTVYIDPFQIKSGIKADLILISHEHYDHCSPEDVAKIVKEDTIIVTEKDSADKLEGNIKVVKPGDKVEEKGITIEILPAYNTDKQFHPQGKGWIGFIVEMDGVRLYHSGDADFIPEMKDLNVDIAFLPVSGTYVMDSNQAVQAAQAIKPKIAIPMHYGAIVGSEQDALDFKKSLEGIIDVKVLKKS